MSEDRIITGIEVTDGSKPDGAQLPTLLDKSKQNGVSFSGRQGTVLRLAAKRNYVGLKAHIVAQKHEFAT